MKFIYTLSCLVVVLGLSGCGSSDSGAGTNAPAGTVATPEEQKAAQENMGSGAAPIPGKEDAPTGGAALNTPGNEMPADTSK